MYGLLYPGAPMAYFASVRLDRDHSDDLGFDQAEVPGGLYGRRLVRDWEGKLAELPEIFDELHADLVEAGYFVDTTRPSLEFYRRSDELVIMVPVLPAESRPSDLSSQHLIPGKLYVWTSRARPTSSTE